MATQQGSPAYVGLSSFCRSNMDYGESMNMWKWPDTKGYGPDDAYPLAQGQQLILTPNELVFLNRNLTFEFLFTGVTAADVGTKIQIYTAIDMKMFAASNATEIVDAVEIDATVAASGTIGFAREVKNVDSGFFRIQVRPSSAPTAKVIMWVKAGGYAK